MIPLSLKIENLIVPEGKIACFWLGRRTGKKLR